MYPCVCLVDIYISAWHTKDRSLTLEDASSVGGYASGCYIKRMILIFHIFIALSSIVSSTAAYLSPSKTKLRLTNGLIVLTLASGTYLVWSTHSPLVSSCITGLLYLGVVLSGVVAASRKLAHEREKADL